MTKETKVTLNLKSLNTYLLIGLLIIVAFGFYSLMQVQKAVKEIKPAETPKLSQLTVTVLTGPECKDCFDASVYASAIKQLPLTNVTENKIMYDTGEGKKLIVQYNITRLPAAIVTGEIDNTSIPGFTKMESAYVFSETPPPYYDIIKARVVGKVVVTYITDKDCKDCFNVTSFTGQFKQLGVVISSIQQFDAASTEAKTLIDKYSIDTVPTMLLSKDALEYDAIAQVWSQAGSKETDGTLVLRTAIPPFKDLKTKKVNGLVTITYLVDPSCDACYNVSLHKLLLVQGFGMQFKEEKTIDVTSPSGKKLIEKYNITLVPTYIIDKEAAIYKTLLSAWEQVGTQEDDGTFVFRNVNLLQGIAYKDLSTNQIVNVTESEGTPASSEALT